MKEKTRPSIKDSIAVAFTGFVFLVVSIFVGFWVTGVANISNEYTIYFASVLLIFSKVFFKLLLNMYNTATNNELKLKRLTIVFLDFLMINAVVGALIVVIFVDTEIPLLNYFVIGFCTLIISFIVSIGGAFIVSKLSE